MTAVRIFQAPVQSVGHAFFDFNQETARRFLLSNCRYWLEEFRVDGFRFDAVGNILYLDHGLDDDFSHAGRCFYGKDNQPRADADGELYLCLANALTHEIHPAAVTIAEEFSGMPGLTCPPEAGGLGFDYRFAMGIPDYWAKCVQSPRDMGSLWHEMTNHRPYDRTISYVECHDQCINGEDAMIWRLLGPAMYTGMGLAAEDWKISRGLAFTGSCALSPLPPRTRATSTLWAMNSAIRNGWTPKPTPIGYGGWPSGRTSNTPPWPPGTKHNCWSWCGLSCAILAQPRCSGTSMKTNAYWPLNGADCCWLLTSTS